MPSTPDEGKEELPLRPSKNDGRGDCGRQIDLKVNSFPITLRMKSISVYDVQFDPPLPSDALNIRKKTVMTCKEKVRDSYGVWFYDNTRIWATRVVEGTVEFDAVTRRPDDNQKFSIRFLKTMELDTVSQAEQEMIIHIVMQKAIRASNLIRIGRNFFDENQLQDDDTNQVVERGFPSLKLWRGYSIAVEPTQAGLQLKADVFHRILQKRCVRDLMDEIERDVKASMGSRSKEAQAHEIESRVLVELSGAAVLTMYNKRVWRIHGVDYTTKPQDTFTQDDGVEISYQEYYLKRYGTVTRSEKKGMLVHIPKKKGKNDPDRRVILHPELCFLTGLNKKMKENYRFMRQMADKTRLGASKRYNSSQSIVRRLEDVVQTGNKIAIAKERDCKAEEVDLNDVDEVDLEMPVHINADQRPLNGRVLDPVMATMSKNGREREFNALKELQKEWGRCEFVNPKLKKINSWAVLCEKREKRTCQRLFMTEIQRLAKEQDLWGKTLSDTPRMLDVPDHVESRIPQHACWENFIARLLKKKPEIKMLVCILPEQNNVTAIYGGIKDLCCTQYSVLSQCIQAKNILNDNRRNAICRNLLKQMMTKAGNVPWKVATPLPDASITFEKPTMIVGIDVNHDLQRANSTVGFCASYRADFTRYFSYVTTQERGQEIVADTKKLMVKALKDFYGKYKVLPDNIICYRDGVSNSQLDAVVEGEVKQMIAAFEKMKEKYPKMCTRKGKSKITWKPKLSMIVVQKRVTARFLTTEDKSVPAGTVVDHGIVSSKFWDFYLVTCEAPSQGTATSTRYIVVWNDLKMSQNDVQSLTHQMCNLYFNWPGPVRVPAPCMYASKLAYLYGTAMCDKKPSDDLYDLLYFL